MGTLCLGCVEGVCLQLALAVFFIGVVIGCSHPNLFLNLLFIIVIKCCFADSVFFSEIEAKDNIA